MSNTKVIEILNKVLINDDDLKELLAEAAWGGGDPAIYDTWAEQDVEFPYVIITYNFPVGNHWAKKSGIFNVDIFTKGNSSVEAEKIKERIAELWDRKQFSSDESGPGIRPYLDVDGIIPEDTPEIVHWNMQFNIVFWRKAFIGHLTDT